MTASRACSYLQNAAATTYKKFLQFYAKRSCKKHFSTPWINLEYYAEDYFKVEENSGNNLKLRHNFLFGIVGYNHRE